MDYSDVMQYFDDHPEDQDGRRFGLAFSILALRGEGLRPELMRVGRSGDEIVSRLEIPLDDSFSSIRDRIRRGEEVRPFTGEGTAPNLRELSLSIDETVFRGCPLCGRQVDERVFFQPAPDEWIDPARVREERADWNADDGACATCLATFAPAGT